MKKQVIMGRESGIFSPEELMEQYYVTAGYQREELYVSVRIDEFRSVWLSFEEARSLEKDLRRRLSKTMLYLSEADLYISGKGIKKQPVKIDGLYLDLMRLDMEPEFYERRNGIRLLLNPCHGEDDLVMFDKNSLATLLRCLKSVPKEERKFHFVDVTIYRE